MWLMRDRVGECTVRDDDKVDGGDKESEGR